MFSRRSGYAGTAIVALFAFTIFACTAYPTITWWDSSQYSLAAATLGITAAPGSLLLTLAGWIVAQLPLGLSTAHALNLFAGVLGAATVSGILLIAMRLRTRTADAVPAFGPLLATGAGALCFAFSSSFWPYATQFTPYVLTTVFTCLILWSALRWWEVAEFAESWRWILCLGLLIGIDFSVHRTNALLLPSLFIWVALRYPRALISLKNWSAGIGGLLLGLCLQLLIIPMAAADPAFNMGEPSNWSRFVEHLTLAQMGGLPPILHRNGPWSLQILSFWNAFRDSFFHVTGTFGILGLLPGMFGLIGCYLLVRRDRRVALGLVAMFVVHVCVTIIYWNIPENYFRTLFRHYLPVFVLWGVFMAYGMGETLTRFWRYRWGRILATLMVTGAVATQLVGNWAATDSSRSFFVGDFARIQLLGLPRDAVLLVAGDNDYFPLRYMQVVEHVRPDVQVVSVPMTGTSWYLDQLRRHDPGFPQTTKMPKGFYGVRWNPARVTLPVSGTAEDFGLPGGLVLPDSVAFDGKQMQDGEYVVESALLVFVMLKDNHWRRPICVDWALGGALPWLQPYLRLDGLFWRIVPLANTPVNVDILRNNLMQVFQYRGLDNVQIPVDNETRREAAFYYPPFTALMHAQLKLGMVGACRATQEAVARLVPLERFGADSSTHAIAAACEEVPP